MEWYWIWYLGRPVDLIPAGGDGVNDSAPERPVPGRWMEGRVLSVIAVVRAAPVDHDEAGLAIAGQLA